MYWLTCLILATIPFFLLIILYDRLTASDEDKAQKFIVTETGKVLPKLSLLKGIGYLVSVVLGYAVLMEIWNYIMC